MVLASGIVPVRLTTKGWEFLLLRCFKYWDFPKGEIDPGENSLEAAIRELQEETALTSPEFNWGETFYETEPYSKGKVARYYLAKITTSQEIKLLPNPVNGLVEHHEYRWVDFEAATKLVNPRIKKVLDWAHHLCQKS